ncbi:MAG: DNA polymerase III subunit alpha [Alphaproteobacteria bacterium]|nr:DNA polymerase III subunit alpha [Alphaproteobacteria bacterium]
MPQPNFIHLRVHSAYSLSEGAIKIPDLIALCQEHDMPAVALTDTGNLFGALEFSIAASKAGLQPIIGCQVLVDRPEDCGGKSSHRANAQRPSFDTLILLAQNQDGYRNLVKLVSRSFLETPPDEKAHIKFSDLSGFTDGVIALTGGPDGALGRLLSDEQRPAADVMAQKLKELFPGRLYIELLRHGRPQDDQIDGPLIEIAFSHDLPVVATNNSHFADESMYEAHDALLCIADSAHIDQEDRRRLTPQHGFRSQKEMLEAFSDIPEAISNTVVIAQRCAFMPEEHAPILPAFPTLDGRSESEQLRTEAEDGLALRLKTLEIDGDDAKPYQERLNFELGVILEMGFPGYFLIVADFIQWSKNQGIPVGPGRGSGAGSVVAWALTITDLDPLKFGLLFERFLNPERVSMPDFDIDFCQDRRDEVIQYVQEKYGKERVAQIIAFGKLQARAVLRDVGRVLGMPYGYVDRICKLIPFNPAHPPTLQEALDVEPELRRLRDEDEQVARLLDIGLKLEGLYRHASTHAAGVVIGDQPLDEFVPMYRDPRSDMAATQFSMKYAEAAGLVKFDFLGLKTLTVLDKAVALIKEGGVTLDLTTLPFEDEKTFEMLGKGDTIGVFQLESTGMRDVLRQMKPDCFEDIIALVALYRPGPMDNIPRYIACKHGEEEPDYLHPDIESILTETFGVMIYQEQVMQIAQVLSGFSLGNADLLRRAMGKKIKSEMDAQRIIFVEGAEARGVDGAQAAQIFEQVNKFAGYGFNKSHAAAYALVAYQTAWLKANYPVEFLAASMTLDMGNTDKLKVFKDEIKKLEFELLPPDINESHGVFSVRQPQNDEEKGAIRYALAAVKNVGIQAMDALVEERRDKGPFQDIWDFAERVGGKVANKRQLENLIKAGAFECLDINRRKLLEGVDVILKTANAAEREREDNQVNLFGGDSGLKVVQQQNLPEVEDWPKNEKLNEEAAAVGFFLSAHPLDSYGSTLERLGVVSFTSLTVASAGSRPKLAGVVQGKRERTSAKGNRFAFVEFLGREGVFEVVMFSEVLAASRELLDSGRPLLVACEARADGGEIKLNSVGVSDLDQAVARSGAGLKVHLNSQDSLEALKLALAGGKEGRGQVRLVLNIDQQQTVEVALPSNYLISADMRSAIESVPGVIEIRDI